MKVTVEGTEFRDAMKTAAVLFDAEIDVLVIADEESGRLILESGQNGIYCKQTLEANVEEAGQIVLSCAHFSSLSFSEQVNLQANGKQVQFKSGRFKGTIAGKSKAEAIEASRPDVVFDTTTNVPIELFKSALGRVTFGQALPGAQSGIRVQTGDKLTLSTTDGYRATIFKEDLAMKQDEFDVILSPAFLHTVLGRVKDLEVGLGVNKGTFRLKTEILDIYHPAIQSTPEDIEEWIVNGIDYTQRLCQLNTTAEALAKAIRDVSSIHMGSVAYDTYVDFLVKGDKAHLRCSADHGSTQTSVLLDQVDNDKFITKLSSRYALEMLNLVKAGEISVQFWDQYLLFTGISGKFRAMIPTVAA